MFTIPQLQAFDVILKSMSSDPGIPKFKLVIEHLGRLWSGDFVFDSGFYLIEPYIDGHGDLEQRRTSIDQQDGVHDAIFSVWEGYNKRPQKYFKILKAGNPAYLFSELTTLISNHTTGKETSVLHQYLFNAQTVDGAIDLPFIDLTGQKVKLVSLLAID